MAAPAISKPVELVSSETTPEAAETTALGVVVSVEVALADAAVVAVGDADAACALEVIPVTSAIACSAKLAPWVIEAAYQPLVPGWMKSEF